MVGAETPIGQSQDVGFRRVPFAGHAVTEQNVINAAVGVFLGVKMCPGDVAGGQAAVGLGLGIAIALGGAGVNKGFFAPTNDGFDGVGVVEIVEIAEHDEVHIGVGGEMGIDFLAKNLGFLQAEVGLVGFGNGPARFEMGGDQREGIIGVYLNVHLGEATADAESTPV